MKKRLLPLAGCILFFLFAPVQAEDVTFPTSSVTIATRQGKVTFDTEVATSNAQQEHGLMFRKSMAQDHGMFFVFPRPGIIQMWMKDTFIPLDMFFINEHDVIVYIAADTTAQSTDLIGTREPVHAVLELNAGAAKHYHIAPGDKVMYAGFP